jgi:hypothetical protein
MTIMSGVYKKTGINKNSDSLRTNYGRYYESQTDTEVDGGGKKKNGKKNKEGNGGGNGNNGGNQNAGDVFSNFLKVIATEANNRVKVANESGDRYEITREELEEFRRRGWL